MVAMALIGVVVAKLASKLCVWRVFAIGLYSILVVGLMIYSRLKSPNSWVGLVQKCSSVKSGVAAQKTLEVPEGEGKMGAWGYNPTYHSETGPVQLTRLSTSSAFFNEEHGYELIPEVRDFVASHCELFDEIDGGRIYRWCKN